MRKMGYEPFMWEQDAKIVERWIMKVDKNMIQIKIPEGLQVNYAIQLLFDRDLTW